MLAWHAPSHSGRSRNPCLGHRAWAFTKEKQRKSPASNVYYELLLLLSIASDVKVELQRRPLPAGKPRMGVSYVGYAFWKLLAGFSNWRRPRPQAEENGNNSKGRKL